MSIKCDICGKDAARRRQVTRTYGKGANMLVIENVPVISCTSCGQSYLEAETLREIEHIKSNRKKMTVKRPMAVAEYA